MQKATITEIQPSADDLKLLAIMREFKQPLFDFYAKKMGYETWYEDFSNTVNGGDYSPKDFYQSEINLATMNYFFARVYDETKFFDGVKE